MKTLFMVIIIILILILQTQAAVIQVPAHYQTIQAAISAANHSDTVLVASGIYYENINFSGKNIVLGSMFLTTGDTSYISSCIIDGNQNASVVTFTGREDSTALLCGMTIQNGSNIGGGGIYCFNSYPTFKNLIIRNNTASRGGGFYFNTSQSRLESITLRENTAEYGSGITCENSGLRIRDIIVQYNTAEIVGGGLYISNSSNLYIYNALIDKNEANYGGGILIESANLEIHHATISDNLANNMASGIFLTSKARLSMTNSIVWGKDEQNIHVLADGTSDISYSDIQGGWSGEGNIDADPLFEALENEDYRLSEFSPCIGSGILSVSPEMDLYGNQRPDPAGSTPDIGAFENELSSPLQSPGISVSADTLDFGQILFGTSSSQQLVVRNRGNQDLLIFEAVCDLTEFTVSPTYASADPGEEEIFTIVFTPSGLMDYSASLTLNSNDPVKSPYVISLIGQGVEPPVLTISPDSLVETLFTGGSVVQTITLGNVNGGSDLHWQIALENIGQGEVTFTKNDYADWTQVENQDRITDNVWLTRANTNGLFNAATESGYNPDSPDDTEWAFGLTKDLNPKEYQVWRDAVYPPPSMVGQPLSLHLISDDIYFDILFHSWTSGGNGGGFSYTRSDILPDWIKITQQSGAITPGALVNIDITFDAANLDGGVYNGSIIILSNDPVHNEYRIPVKLNVAGAPHIAVTPDNIDFGSVFLGTTKSIKLYVHNDGFQDLLIFSAETDRNEFNISPTSASIDPQEADSFTVNFTPVDEAEYPGRLILISNDPDQDTLIVPLSGRGLEPPVITVLPDSLGDILYTGNTSLHKIVLGNTNGGSDLVWEIQLENVGQGSVTFTKQDYADWTIRDNQDRITDNVWITRANKNGLFNANTESGYDYSSPDDTEWAFGLTNDLSPEDYRPWREAVYPPPSMVNQPLSLHLISDDLYFDVIFHSWTGGGNGGGFSYTRTDLSPIWVEMETISGIVPMGSSTEVGVTFNAVGLFGGEYTGNMIIMSNDPITPEYKVQLNLSVIGAPDINYSLAGFDSTSTQRFNTIDAITQHNFVTPYSSAGDGHLHITVEGDYNSSSEYADIYIDGILIGIINPGVREPTTKIFKVSKSDLNDYLSDGTVHVIIDNSPAVGGSYLNSYHTVRLIYYGAIDTLSFGGSYLNYATSRTIIIENTGTDLLELSDISVNNNVFSLSHSSLNINFNEQDTLTVFFLPTALQTYTGMITFTTNDPDEETIEIPVSGTGIEPPIISVHPDSINVEMNTGETSLVILAISNSGGSELRWQTEIESLGQISVTFTKSDYADWTNPDNQDRITDNVWITRDDSRGLFNAVSETGYDYTSPYDTEWAYGLTKDLTPTDYRIWREAVYPPPGMVGQSLSLHLISDDLYYDCIFHSWTAQNSGGGFSYTRTEVTPNWLDITNSSGVIPADSSLELNIYLNSQELFGGDYLANILIHTNDPANPKMIVPLHLKAIGIAKIQIAQDVIDFGTSYVGFRDSCYLKIDNIGTDILELSEIVSTDGHLTFSPVSLSIPYQDSDSLIIYLLHESVGQFSSNITFNTNDPDSGAITIPVISSIFIAPDISVEPDSISIQATSVEILSDTINIYNQGGSELIYNIKVESPGLSFVQENFNSGFPQPDFTLYDNATYNSTEGRVYLTTAEDWLSGGMFFNDRVRSSYLEIGFDFEIGGGSGADGMALVFMDSPRLGYGGGGLGFHGTDGWAVEFDTWANSGETENHISVTTADDVNYYVNNTIPDLEDTGIFFCEVIFNQGYLEVYLENPSISFEKTKVIEYTFTNLTEINSYLGFTAATGGLNNNHIVDNIRISGNKNWLTVLPESGTIEQNESEEIVMWVNPEGLSDGSYNANLILNSNDPDASSVNIPVIFEVTTGLEDLYSNKIPQTYSLGQNYPNPFNPVTHIQYGLPKTGDVKIEIYNILGQKIKTLLNKQMPAGYHEVEFNAQNLSSGVYLYRIEASEFQDVKKMILLK